MDTPYKFVRGEALTEDNIVIYNITASEVPQNAAVRDIKRYFKRFGKIVKVRRLDDRNGKNPSKTETAQKPLCDSKYAELDEMSEFEIQYANAKSAARALRQSKRFYKNHVILIKASQSFEQPEGQQIIAHLKEKDFSIQDNQAPITTLNDDCLEYICKFLNPTDQVNFALSYRRFAAILALLSKVQYKDFDFFILSDMTYFQLRIFMQIVGPQIKSITVEMNLLESTFGPESELNPFLGTVLFNVEKLKVCESTSDTLYKLLENMHLLKELELQRSLFSDDFIQFIETLKNLKKLTIMESDITGSGIEKLTGLEHLALYNCPDIFPHFKDICKNLINLTHLGIGCFQYDTGLVTKDYEHVAKYLQQLKTLNIVYMKGDCSSLADLPNLTKLKISFNGVEETEEFFTYLIKHQTSQVEELCIRGLDFSPKVATSLTKLKKLKNLDCIFYTDNETIKLISQLTELEEIEIHYFIGLSADGILNLLENCLRLKRIRFWCPSTDHKVLIHKSRKLLESQRKRGIRTSCVNFIFKTPILQNIPKHESSDVLKITDEVFSDEDFDKLMNPMHEADSGGNDYNSDDDDHHFFDDDDEDDDYNYYYDDDEDDYIYGFGYDSDDDFSRPFMAEYGYLFDESF